MIIIFTVVGNQIYIHRYDELAFRVVYRGEDNSTENFEATDILTMNIKSLTSKELLVQKISDSFLEGDKEISIFVFTSEDYEKLSPGDYIYDLVVDTSAGSRHVLVDKAYFSVLESPGSDYDIEFGRLSTLDSKEIYVSEVPLICRFDYSKVDKVEAEGTLILFNRSKSTVKESQGDDTLILFSQTPKEDDEGTLILF